MIRGKTNTINSFPQKGYPSNMSITSIGPLLGYNAICSKSNVNCVGLAPQDFGTEMFKNDKGCQSEKMYTTNDTPMGSNTKTSVNTNKTIEMTIAHDIRSRSKLLLQ